MSIHGEALDDSLSAIQPDQPVDKRGCHSFVSAESTDECMRGVE